MSDVLPWCGANARTSLLPFAPGSIGQRWEEYQLAASECLCIIRSMTPLTPARRIFLDPEAHRHVARGGMLLLTAVPCAVSPLPGQTAQRSREHLFLTSFHQRGKSGIARCYRNNNTLLSPLSRRRTKRLYRTRSFVYCAFCEISPGFAAGGSAHDRPAIAEFLAPRWLATRAGGAAKLHSGCLAGGRCPCASVACGTSPCEVDTGLHE